MIRRLALPPLDVLLEPTPPGDWIAKRFRWIRELERGQRAQGLRYWALELPR